MTKNELKVYQDLLWIAQEFLDSLEIRGSDPEYREHIRDVMAKAEEIQ